MEDIEVVHERVAHNNFAKDQLSHFRMKGEREGWRKISLGSIIKDDERKKTSRNEKLINYTNDLHSSPVSPCSLASSNETNGTPGNPSLRISLFIPEYFVL